MGTDVPFIEYAEVNPKRNLRRGAQYPFVEMNAVPEGGGEPAYFTEREYDGGGGSRFAVGDTLFARITPCTENGKIAYVAGLNGSDAAFGSTELIVLSARVGKAEPRFIYQVAASQRVRRRAVSRMLGTSGRQRVPTWFFTEELTVPAFTLSEQRAIAAVLDAIDEAIKRTEAVIAATERLREALLNELLTRGVHGWHSEWMQAPGLGTVPACWDVVRLADALAELRYGTSTQLGASGTYAVLRIPNVARGFIDVSEMKYADLAPREASVLALRRGDLLIVRTNGNPEICGQSAVFNELGGRWAFASYLLRLRTQPSVLEPTYLWTYLRSAAGRKQLSANIRTSAGNYNLSAGGLEALQVPLPSVEEQRRIVDVVHTSSEANEAAERELQRLAAVKQSISDALLTGRLRVPGAVEHAR